MTRITGISSLAAITLALGCQQTTTPPPLRSLAQSGSLSMVCRDMVTGQGQDIKGCPDPRAANTTNTSTTGRHTLLMVTQTGRGEVAVVDMTNQRIVDEDPSIPGTEFLPIGAMPVSIASTPGGASTFVATAEHDREAIFVLPTSCIMPPGANEPPRDLTQWSACKLPAAPGEMVIVPDATIDSSGGYRQACPADSVAEVNDVNRSDCPADWDADERIDPPGRRKLLITLPTLGGVALLDARSLYNLQPGSFQPCVIERWLELSKQVPTNVSQEIPDDLKAPPNCSIPNRYSFGPPQSGYVSQPAGIAFKDGQLYVADLGVPVVHNLDLADPCNPRELAPLVPSSINEPARSVFTSDVAVSDLTRDGKQRFVYAVDDYQGSLMAFDVSPGSQQRSPLVFSASYLPFDPPDRIRTSISNARVRDLMFVTHDVPFVNPDTTSASTGVLCDPSPLLDTTVPAAEYRTSSDYTRGAAPSKLRGTFAVVALTDGNVGVVDVEDFDTPCRRPVDVNQPWRGCIESVSQPYRTSSGSRTVSDEASCRVVEPHRARSGRFVATNSTVGTGAPSLPTFPALTSPSGELAAGSSSQGSHAPKLLAVPYPVAQPDAGAPPVVAGHSEVYVGSTLYWVRQYNSESSTELGATLLDVAPSSATNNSVLLPFVEPRAYLPSENFSLTYEGKLFDDRQSGYFFPSNTMTFVDPDARFCDQGVQDIDLTTRMADDFVSTSDAQLAASQRSAFAPNHTDFVQITSKFSDNDPYWTNAPGSTCAKASATGISGINGCRSYFGTAENDNLKSTRELTILEAYQDRLVLEPRDGSATTIANLHCCFPGTVMYTVRGAHQWVMRGQQPMINVTVNVGANNRCVRDCDPRKAHLRNRAIEIASSPKACLPSPSATPCTCASPDPDTGKCSISTEPPAIGPSTDLDAVCVVGDDVQVDPNSTSLPTGCVFDSLKARFAVYAGASPSVRDMTFAWQVSGGFVPYELNLANNLTGSSIMPQSMTPAPNLNALFVVDSVSGGVFELVLDPFGINGNPYL